MADQEIDDDDCDLDDDRRWENGEDVDKKKLVKAEAVRLTSQKAHPRDGAGDVAEGASAAVVPVAPSKPKRVTTAVPSLAQIQVVNARVNGRGGAFSYNENADKVLAFLRAP